MKRQHPDAKRFAAAALADLDRARAAVERLSTALNCPLNAPENALLSGKDHLRQHRMGVPARLDSDAELREFIIMRMGRMTFPQLAAAVAEAFPKSRCISQSTIHRWWHRKGKFITPNHQSPHNPR